MRQRSVAVLVIPFLVCLVPADSYGGATHPIISISFTPTPAAKSKDTHLASSAFGTTGFELSRIDKGVVREFQKAWWASHGGTSFREGAVLIFRRLDGTYFAKSMGKTNQHRSFTFTWVPNAIAVVHTHPNSSNPRPSQDDIRVAEKYRIPVCTITRWGMFVYDPISKTTLKVRDNLDWLDSTKFSLEALRQD